MLGDASHGDQDVVRAYEKQAEQADKQARAQQLTPRGQAVTPPGSYATRHMKMMQLTATKSPRPSHSPRMGQELDAAVSMGQHIDQQYSQVHAMHQPAWNSAGNNTDRNLNNSKPLAKLSPAEQSAPPVELDTSSAAGNARPVSVPRLNLGHMLAQEHSGTSQGQGRDPSSAAAMPPPPAPSLSHRTSKQTGLTMGLSGTSAKRVVVSQGKHPGQLSSASTMLPLASGSSGPESWRRLSHELNPEQAAAALDRREQLRQFQAQKAAGKSKGLQQGKAGMEDTGSRPSSRPSLGGGRAATRPPLPSSQLRTGMITAAAGVAQAASKPLPDDGGDEGQALLTHRPANTTKQDVEVVQPAHTSHIGSSSTTSPPVGQRAALPASSVQINSRFSFGGGASAAANAIASIPPPPHGRFSLGGPGNLTARNSTGGGSALYTPRSGTAVAVVSAQQAAAANAMHSMAAAAAAGFADVRQDIRNLKLQELQLRYLNARMEQSLQLRKQKGEQALASCLLAISDMERSTCAAQAAAARNQLQQRASTAASAMQPVLQQLHVLQGRQHNPEAVLAAVRQALLHSLTSVPLICGAVCGNVAQADLEALETVMTRGMHALMQIDHSLQPLLGNPGVEPQGSASISNSTAQNSSLSEGLQGQTKSSSSSSSSAIVQVPTATVLTELVACIKSEVHSLQDVLSLLQQLRSKQLLISSYQAQLVQIRRRLGG